jgi:plastocyanin
MRPRRSLRPVVTAAVVALTFGATACSSSSHKVAAPTTPTDGATVQISGFAFKAPAVNVKVGTAVTWTNKDSTTHTATSTSGPGSFDSGDLDTGKTFSKTFTKAGTYSYFCHIHNGMRGTVVVTA